MIAFRTSSAAYYNSAEHALKHQYVQLACTTALRLDTTPTADVNVILVHTRSGLKQQLTQYS